MHHASLYLEIDTPSFRDARTDLSSLRNGKADSSLPESATTYEAELPSRSKIYPANRLIYIDSERRPLLRGAKFIVAASCRNATGPIPN